MLVVCLVEIAFLLSRECDVGPMLTLGPRFLSISRSRISFFRVCSPKLLFLSLPQCRQARGALLLGPCAVRSVYGDCEKEKGTIIDYLQALIPTRANRA